MEVWVTSMHPKMFFYVMVLKKFVQSNMQMEMISGLSCTNLIQMDLMLFYFLPEE